jgi:hypothetical protein
MKAAMPAPEPLCLVRVAKGGAGALGRSGVREHRDEWRLVGHQGCYVVGIGRHECERGHRAATAREHLDGAGAERLDDGVYVVRLDCGRVVDPAVLADAAAEAAWVIGDHGTVREVRRQRVEAAGGHRLADHEQRWASVDGGQRATDVVGDLGLGGFEHVRCHASTTAPASKTHRALAEGTTNDRHVGDAETRVDVGSRLVRSTAQRAALSQTVRSTLRAAESGFCRAL